MIITRKVEFSASHVCRAPHVEGFRLETARDLEAAHRALEATHVLELASRAFDTLSSGERQRVAIGRALMNEPELVRAMDLLLQCNRRLVSSGLDEALVLQQTLVQIVNK